MGKRIGRRRPNGSNRNVEKPFCWTFNPLKRAIVDFLTENKRYHFELLLDVKKESPWYHLFNDKPFKGCLREEFPVSGVERNLGGEKRGAEMKDPRTGFLKCAWTKKKKTFRQEKV